MKALQTLLLLIVGLFSATSASAADCYARGVARCILDDGSGNYPISDAGEVFVGTSPNDVPQWTAGEHASATLSAPHNGTSASGTTFYFYYWARAKAGYTFVGWATTNTSREPSPNTERLEGQPWESKKGFSSAKTAAQPNESVRYAIFRKNAAEDTSGGGIKLVNVTGNSHTFGSTTNDWSIRLNYQAPLAYRDFAGYADGYGTNKALISAITCTEKTSGTTVAVKNARVSGSPTADGADAYGLVFFPADMPVGTYSVHVPKGLFTTQLAGTVTAAADFDVVVTPDNTPFTISSTSPTAGQNWDASEATQKKETDGNFSTITLTFNKNIARVAAEGKDVVLTNSTTGRVSRFTICSVSATTNKRLGIIAFENQPDGDYVFTLPAGVFFDASGNGNASFTLKFSVKGSNVDPWELPTYNNVTTEPSNNSTVDELSEVTVAFSRAGYALPQQLYLNTAATAAKIKEIYTEGSNYNDPDVRPEIQSENISGVKLAFEDGLLKVQFAYPIAEATKVVVGIPGQAIINLNARSQTPQALYELGGCTNAPIQLVVNVKPNTITGIESAVDAGTVGQETIFRLDGTRINELRPGVNIVRTTHTDGSTTTRKVIK